MASRRNKTKSLQDNDQGLLLTIKQYMVRAAH